MKLSDFRDELINDKRDRRILIPRPFPRVGWTINFAHPTSWIFIVLLVIFMLVVVFSCSDKIDPIDTTEGEKKDTITTTIDTTAVNKIINLKDTLLLSFYYGEDGPSSDYKNSYVAWLESTDFIQHLYVCQRLMDGSLTGTALPYWKMNKYKKSMKAEVDAVTGATKQNCDFTLLAVIKNSDQKKIKVNFETDRSFDENDWFSNQPALLYSVEIDLTDTLSSYELTPVGWTPNEDTKNEVDNTPMGVLQTEMRYITHHKAGNTFGQADDRGVTKMVKKITARVY